MGGIYIHIPFCRKACTYCDFYFSTSLDKRADMVRAILREMHERRTFFGPPQPLSTLYFGGGTPSVLSAEELRSMIDLAARIWGFEAGAEITLEANPDDLSLSYLHDLRAIGVNRLSIGVQSFLEEDLQTMNRSHSAAQSLAALGHVREAGFTDWTLDLIFGLPGRSLEEWRRNLEKALALEPPHLSVYSLTVEEKTVLAHQIKTRKVHLPTDERFEAQFILAHDFLTTAGYEHYELSNYALPGYRAVHNSAYWAGKPYLGLGPSAHAFDGRMRSWNVANNHRYLHAIGQQGIAIDGDEVLSARDRYHEYLMMGLRTDRGIDVDHITATWMPDWPTRFRRTLHFWTGRGVLIQSKNLLRLNPTGWYMSDRICSDFFLEDSPS